MLVPQADGLLEGDATFDKLELVENVRVDDIVIDDDAAVVADSVGE